MEDQEERRDGSRVRALKGGHIVFNAGFSAAECRIRNISSNGAMIEFSGVIALPSDFTLYVESQRQSWPCKVAWRSGRRVGVSFTGPPIAKPLRFGPPTKRRGEGY